MVMVRATAVEQGGYEVGEEPSCRSQFCTILSVCLWMDFCQCDNFTNVLTCMCVLWDQNKGWARWLATGLNVNVDVWSRLQFNWCYHHMEWSGAWYALLLINCPPVFNHLNSNYQRGHCGVVVQCWFQPWHLVNSQWRWRRLKHQRLSCLYPISSQQSRFKGDPSLTLTGYFAVLPSHIMLTLNCEEFQTILYV